jgi:hypothetical protein
MPFTMFDVVTVAALNEAMWAETAAKKAKSNRGK